MLTLLQTTYGRVLKILNLFNVKAEAKYMKLQPANKMSKVADENYEKFKQSVLESEEFEALITGIKEAANEGQKTLFCNTTDQRAFKILKDVLVEAGYGVNEMLFNSNVMQITW